MEAIPISRRIVQWKGPSTFEFEGKSMKTETTIWSEFSNGGNATVEQILASDKIN